MAYLTSYNGFRFDMIDPGSMPGGDIVDVRVSSTKVEIISTTGVFTGHGTGISFDPETFAATGTFQSVTFSQNGTVMAALEGVALSAQDMVWAAATSEEAVWYALAQFGGNDTIVTSTANDVLYGGPGSDTIDAGFGFDTVVYLGSSSSHAVTHSADGSITVSSSEGVDTLRNVERIQFSDGILAFDDEGAAGQAYRLYQAAFAREPDVGGVSYWADALGTGVTLHQAAAGFLASSEFQSAYGANLSIFDFVTKLYGNVLGRDADAAGVDYWVGQLEAGAQTRTDVLVNFSESGENVALVANAISDGIWLAF
jgi:hypothetical protein